MSRINVVYVDNDIDTDQRRPPTLPNGFARSKQKLLEARPIFERGLEIQSPNSGIIYFVSFGNPISRSRLDKKISNSSKSVPLIPKKSNEINFLASDCIFKLPLSDQSATGYVDTSENSLSTKFTQQCDIAKHFTSVKTEIKAVEVTDFQLCGLQALNDFETLLTDTTPSDVKIKTTVGKSRNFNCHKSILAARSPVLHWMLETSMKEAKENVVTVEDISGDTMAHFLSFLYCGRFQEESWIKSLPQLTYAADKYCVDSLKFFCDLNLIKSVTCKNALAIADLAQRHELPKAVQDIKQFIAENAGRINLDFSNNNNSNTLDCCL